jgi:anti-sigma factor RsiW
MMVDDPTLLAFVDGELDPASREKVEAVLAHNPELEAQVAALSASCLPYRTAFDKQVLPELPPALVQRVASLVSVPQAPSAPRRSRRHWLGMGGAIAASFTAGAWLPWRVWTESQESSGWVEAIVSYQALYVRETVEQISDAPARLSTLLDGFDNEQKSALFVPDLRAADLAFKRVQQLGYGGSPLIQMVYLPPSGKPVALCALPMKRMDSNVQTRVVEGMSVSSWQRHGLAFVLAADMPQAQVALLAQRLSEGGFARL